VNSVEPATPPAVATELVRRSPPARNRHEARVQRPLGGQLLAVLAPVDTDAGMTTNGYLARLQADRQRQAPPPAPPAGVDSAIGDAWAASILADSPMRAAYERHEQHQRRRAATRFDGYSCIVQIDRGRIQFTKPLQHLKWDPTAPLEVWIEDGRLFIARQHPTFGSHRGAAVTCRKNDNSWRLPVFAPMRRKLGVDDGDHVLVVADAGRDVAFIDDVRRLIHHLYPEYEPEPEGRAHD
jgi:hypothetical protein